MVQPNTTIDTSTINVMCNGAFTRYVKMSWVIVILDRLETLEYSTLQSPFFRIKRLLGFVEFLECGKTMQSIKIKPNGAYLYIVYILRVPKIPNSYSKI